MTAIEKFTQFYQGLDTKAIEGLTEVYATNVVFIDPVTRHEGIGSVREYFERLFDTVEHCSFHIEDISAVGNKYFVTWKMQFQSQRLRAGKPVAVDGISELHSDGDKIIFHRDYYDMGEMIYEHVPLLGRIVKGIKKRMEK